MICHKCEDCDGKGCNTCQDTGWLPYWCQCGMLIGKDGLCPDGCDSDTGGEEQT